MKFTFLVRVDVEAQSMRDGEAKATYGLSQQRMEEERHPPFITPNNPHPSVFLGYRVVRAEEVPDTESTGTPA